MTAAIRYMVFAAGVALLLFPASRVSAQETNKTVTSTDVGTGEQKSSNTATTPVPDANVSSEKNDSQAAESIQPQDTPSQNEQEANINAASPASDQVNESNATPVKSNDLPSTPDDTAGDQSATAEPTPNSENGPATAPGGLDKSNGIDNQNQESPRVITQAPVNIKSDAQTTNTEKIDDAQLEENKRHMFVVTYNLAQPRGKTAAFVDDFSVEGFGFEYRFLVTKQMSTGIAFNWSAFENKDSDTFQLNDRTSVSGTRIKLMDLLQLTASFQYYLKKQSNAVIPFGGIHTGAYYSSHVVDWGWWFDRNAGWQFGFTPEVGIRITALPIPVYLAVRYTYTFKTNAIDAQQALGINLGIAFLK